MNTRQKGRLFRAGNSHVERNSHTDKPMSARLVFDADLIRRYDQSGPRYPSYPTVAQFHDNITEDEFAQIVGDPEKWALVGTCDKYF